MATFAFRLGYRAQRMSDVLIFGNFGGVIGNYNARKIVYPNIDWPRIAQEFVTSLDLEFNPYATQTESHHYIFELFDNMLKFNQVLVDFADYIGSNISLGYFEQITKDGKIDLCRMPHKLNNFDFANIRNNLLKAETVLYTISSTVDTLRWKITKDGNYELCPMPPKLKTFDFANSRGNSLTAEAVLAAISQTVSTSRLFRWKRDLTPEHLDITELGIPNSLVAYKKFLQGINKLKVNESRLAEDLEKNWMFLAAAINIVMERYDVPESYHEKLTELTRSGVVDKESISSFIKNLDLPEEEKLNLLNLTPHSYTGEAENLARSIDDALGLLSGFKIE